MRINIRNTGHNNRPRLWLAATPTPTIFGTAIHVFQASSYSRLASDLGFHVSPPSTCSRPPRGLDLNDLSYLTIHNIDRRTMLINNIRYTGFNKLDPTTASTCPAILSPPAKHLAPDRQPATNSEQRTLHPAARTNAQVIFPQIPITPKFLNSF